MSEEAAATPEQQKPASPPCMHDGCAAQAVINGPYGPRCEPHIPRVAAVYTRDTMPVVKVMCSCGHTTIGAGQEHVARAANGADVPVLCARCGCVAEAKPESAILTGDWANRHLRRSLAKR